MTLALLAAVDEQTRRAVLDEMGLRSGAARVKPESRRRWVQLLVCRPDLIEPADRDALRAALDKVDAA